MPVHSQEHHQHGDPFNPNPNPDPKSPDSPITTSTTASATATAAASSTSRLLLFTNLNPRFMSFVLKSIIMFFVISSFFLFLGIAALAVLHLFLSGRRLHRFRRSAASETRRGLSPQELQRCLPRFPYAVEVAVDDCAVCLERFSDGQPCRRLPDCCHVFHCGCIDRWLSKVPNCPICRADVRLEPDGSHSDAGDDDSKPLWSIEGSLAIIPPTTIVSSQKTKMGEPVPGKEL